jgi:hypothetical protein
MSVQYTINNDLSGNRVPIIESDSKKGGLKFGIMQSQTNLHDESS